MYQVDIPNVQGCSNRIKSGRIHLNPDEGKYGCSIPKGVWHTIDVLSPSVIFEAKDKKYGEDGTEVFGE